MSHGPDFLPPEQVPPTPPPPVGPPPTAAPPSYEAPWPAPPEAHHPYPQPLPQHQTFPSPEAPAAKVIERPHPLTGLARGGIALVAGLYFVTQELVDGSRGSIRGSLLFVGLGLLGVALLAGISGIFTWRTTTFVADDEEFRIERNFLSRQSSKVDYTKVQSVDVSQPFIARLMGLAKVHIDVGGAGGLDIAFLSKARAESLREHLVERMHRAQLPSPAEPGLPSSDPSAPAHFPPPVLGPDGVPAVAPPPAHAPAQEELVIAVPPSNLLLGTFVSLSTGFALLGAVVLVAIALIAKTPVTLLAAMLGVGGWVWRQTGSNWNFRMTKRDGALRLTRGLLSTTAQGLRPGRIQGVAIKQDLLQRVTGLYQMTVTVLGYGDPTGEENRQTNAVILPFGTWGEVLTVLRAIWPEVDLTQVQPHPQSPKAKWLTPITFSTHTWGIGEHVVVTTHGLLERVTTIVPHRRMQSASIHQGPIQRRLKVASVHVHTTDGPVNQRLYHLDEAVARQVFEEQVARAREARASAA